MMEKFTMKSLVDLDNGRLKEAFELALDRALADCKDRPGVGRARTISLVLTMTPVTDQSVSELESCDVAFDIKESVPKRSTKTYNMRSTRAGLMHNELSPDSAAQGTLDETPGWRPAANE